MSWGLMYTQCWALTGIKHLSKEQFADTISDSYHLCIKRHVDIMSGTPLSFIPQDKKSLLYNSVLEICDSNLTTTGEKNFLQQIGPAIITYWSDMIISGPYGEVVVTYPGVWLAPHIKQNLNFSIMAAMFLLVSKIHLMTLVGKFESKLKKQDGSPLIECPWSGAIMQTFA